MGASDLRDAVEERGKMGEKEASKQQQQAHANSDRARTEVKVVALSLAYVSQLASEQALGVPAH